MWTNYFQVAFRNLTRNKLYSTITILSLAIGLGCVSLILQYLKHELSYDRFHAGAENIYRIAWEDENPQTRTPHPMAQALVQDFPEVENAVSLTSLWGFGLTEETFSFHNLENDARFDESNGLAVDTSFFQVFSFPLLKGDEKNVLKHTDGILLSESMATKYFGDVDPVGKQLAVNDEESLIEVVGVFEDVPTTSHFHFDFLVSYVREKSLEGPESQFYSWADFGHYNYIKLKPGTDAKQLEQKLGEWSRKYIDIPDPLYESLRAKNFGFRLQPITEIHLHSHLRWELEPNGYIAYIYMLVAAAFLILFIACVNFINLTTAQSTGRAKEVGIRKSLGAFRYQLVIQFTIESLLTSVVAMSIAIALIEMTLPFIGRTTGIIFERDYWFFAVTLSILTIVSGISAGIIPSLVMSALKPAAIFKKGHLESSKRWGLRESFIIFQFAASMLLITSSIVIYSQLNFIQTKDMGFDHEQVIVLPVKNPDAINPRLEELRQELTKIKGVMGVSAASNVPGRNYNQNPFFTPDNPEFRVASSESFVDQDFFNVMDIRLSGGRFFSVANPADREAFIVNETAARNLFSGEALGKELSWDFDEGTHRGTVIGVVEDFHFQSLHEPVRPLVFQLRPRYNYVVIRLAADNFQGTIASIENTWKQFEERFTFEFAFLSEYLDEQYRQEKSIARVLSAFSIVAIVIACFGLFAIAALTFRQKVKEVSIRKVLGASVPQIMILLLKNFTAVILVAIALAVPFGWWLMNEWLQNFTIRTTINPMIYVGAAIALIMIAWTTLSYLLWKVSGVNPSETLKGE
jgi:putative ABC transport system permease protein